MYVNVILRVDFREVAFQLSGVGTINKELHFITLLYIQVSQEISRSSMDIILFIRSYHIQVVFHI